MPRELSKCREWEKDRRERLKKGFTSLCKILPCYEPSLTLSKIEILQKAQSYIEELQTQIKELLEGKNTKPECSIIKKLHDRVKRLVIRNEQLCNLLIDAGIRLPSSVEMLKNLEVQKYEENETKKPKKKLQNKNRKVKTSSQRRIPKKSDVIRSQTIATNLLQSSNFITLVTTQSCFIITNAPSTNVNQNCLAKTTTVLTNSNLFSTPLVASAVKPPLVITKTNGAINTVSSGTLLVANGSLLPVIQQPTLVPTQTIITNPTPIVVNPATANNTLFVVPKTDNKDVTVNKQSSILTSTIKTTTNSKTNVLKSLPLLKPKRSDLTKTTHVNKVPIPALTSKYTNNLLPQVSVSQNLKSKLKSSKSAKKESSTKCNKPEKVEEQIKQNEVENNKDVNSLNEDKSNKSQNEENAENLEPTSKKPKLATEGSADNTDENKKINIISTYSIDSLCNALTEPTPISQQSITEKSNCIEEIQTELSKLSDANENANKEEEKIEKEIPVSLPQIQTNDRKETSKTKEVVETSTSQDTSDANISKEKDETAKQDKSSVNQKNLELNNHLMHSDLSNDIFASLSHVSTVGGQNPESTSPTAAFLLAFPLVSSLNSLKVTEVIEDEVTESQHGTPTLLQIGTMDTAKPNQSQSDTLTPSLLNLDNFSFFSKEFYPSFDPIVTSSASTSCTTVTTSAKTTEAKKEFIDFNVNPSEKKVSTSEANSKSDLKYTLKSISNKEPSTYLSNKDPLRRDTTSSSICQNNIVTSTCENISTVSICQSATSISTSQNIPTVSIGQNEFVAPVSKNYNTVNHATLLTSTCQSIHIPSFYQNSTPTNQNSFLIPSTSVPVCQTSSLTPHYHISSSVNQSACQSTSKTFSSSISSSQNAFPTSNCQTSITVSQTTSLIPPTSVPVCQYPCSTAVNKSAPLLPPLSVPETSSIPSLHDSSIRQNASLMVPASVQSSQNTSGPAFYQSSSVFNKNTSAIPSSLLPPVCQNSSMPPLYQGPTVVNHSTPFMPPIVPISQTSSILPRYQGSSSINQNAPFIPVCQGALTIPISQHSAAISHNATLGSIPQTSVSTSLYQSVSVTSLLHNTPITSVSQSQNSNISSKNVAATPISKSVSTAVFCPNSSINSQNSTVPVSQSIPAVSQNAVISLPNTNLNIPINSSSSDYSLSYNHSLYSHAQTATTSSTTTLSTKHQIEKSRVQEKKTCNYYPTTSYSIPQYNTFNPFTDIPKSTVTYPMSTKSYNDALYTSNSTYAYNYHSDNFTSTYSSAKTNTKPEKLYYGLNYDNYDYKHNDFQKYETTRNQQFGNYYNESHIRNKEKTNTEILNKNHNSNTNTTNKATVNWMTTPDIRQHQNDFIVPSLPKEMDFASNPIYSSNSFSTPQTTYFNASTSLYSSNDFHNNAPFYSIPPSSLQRNDLEENQFSWSPSKLPQVLDTTHNFGTLPTLVGDLALGNTQPFVEQKIENKNVKEFRAKDNTRRSKLPTNYDNQSNFLSVSQLVDHNKNDGIPGRVTNRRNSGNRSSNKNSTSSKNSKRKTDKDMHNFNNTKAVEKQIKHTNNQEYQNQNNDNSNWMASSNKNRNAKIPSSSYSAEALIGHHNQNDMNRNRSSQNYPPVNKSLPVPFLTDNILPYFPMDIPQDNTLAQQNQNYQSNTFTHNFSSGIQSSVYPSNTFVPNPVPITTSYLPSTNFIPDIGGNTDYPPILPENTFSHVGNKQSEKFSKNKSLQNEKPNEKRSVAQSNNCSLSTNKKTKKKQPNETPNLSNFDFSFLSMPAAINSPILPDDFHAHTNFLPPPTPTQLYPCKNPLYGKQDLTTNNLLPLPTASRTGVAHPEISPSLNNVGNTLTNFNLSTIFPEINKGSGPMSDIYSENGKAKGYNQREFLGGTSQVRQ
ncbi:helix-loop-helix dna-binding domain [Holotrichia oblita]|uniref:Helix-loop-helix dna-binding domain n=1 Tax=Holotrichia oblita TaxID=644536 RepID=A0ACB9T2I8_HOLOL|nr:helix-loop-helix dna-binding domain [Holotrichia oblita]